jgi:micrococcal nuclease
MPTCLVPLLVSALAAPVHEVARDRSAWEVREVVDGDTLRIARGDREETLRVACVDTEEKLAGRVPWSRTKPETVFGERTAAWARSFFDALGARHGRATVRLRFHDEAEERDRWGRLIAHAFLEDGSDYGLLLVARGKSPYFPKYGACPLSSASYERAEHAARARAVGIWSPRTNAARSRGAPEVRRPYDNLLPWWGARAHALGARRRALVDGDARTAATDDAASVEGALALCAREPQASVRLFGSVARTFEEADGALTVLFDRGASALAVRAVVPAAARTAALERFLVDTRAELHQNFLHVTGRLARGPRGARMLVEAPARFCLACPEPVLSQER